MELYKRVRCNYVRQNRRWIKKTTWRITHKYKDTGCSDAKFEMY
jgi:arsenate reductase-like glutaredoxin family protein